MAITSARMQMRRGLEADFDPSKMLPGEFAVSTDTRIVRICLAPGIVKDIASTEEVKYAILKGLIDIKNAEENALENIADGLDKTLSVEGKAAEAKTTGEKISHLSSEIAELNGDLDILEEIAPYFAEKDKESNFKWVNGKYVDPSSGTLAENISYSYTDFISVIPNKSYSFIGKANIYGAYYDDNKNWVDSIMYQGTGIVNITIKIPENAKYLRLSCETPNVQYMKLSIKDNIVLNDLIHVKKENVEGIHVITVATNGTKQFTSLRSAIDSIQDASKDNRYIIEFYGDGNEYNIYDDFTEVEKNDTNFIGITVPSYVKIKGIGDRTRNIIALRMTTENSKLSTLNINSATELENLCVIGEKVKYAVHDDFHDFKNVGIERHIKNCHFIGITTSSVKAYGAGYHGGYDWYFEDCVFENRADKYGLGQGSFTAHNNIGMIGNANLYFKNCRFLIDQGTTGCTFGSLTSYNGVNEGNINRIYFYGCKTGTIKLIEENASVYGTGLRTIISGYGNDAKNGNVSINNTDGADYSSWIDLV